jgi:hypothetical protein
MYIYNFKIKVVCMCVRARVCVYVNGWMGACVRCPHYLRLLGPSLIKLEGGNEEERDGGEEGNEEEGYMEYYNFQED